MQPTNPFAIRLQLISLAKELLMDEYHTKKDHLLEQWRLNVELVRDKGEIPEGCPTLPEYPTEADILRKAEALNQFVSNSK
jgi:hypothetical protein